MFDKTLNYTSSSMSHKQNELQKLEQDLVEIDSLIEICNNTLSEGSETEHTQELLKMDLIELHKRKAELVEKKINNCQCAKKCSPCTCNQKKH